MLISTAKKLRGTNGVSVISDLDIISIRIYRILSNFVNYVFMNMTVAEYDHHRLLELIYT